MCGNLVDLLRLETDVILSVSYSERHWLHANLHLKEVRLLVGNPKYRVHLEN